MFARVLPISIIFLVILISFNTAASNPAYSLVDTVKVNKLCANAFDLRSDNPAEAIRMANEALEISEALKYETGSAFAFLSRGAAQITLGKSLEAINDLKKAAEIFERNRRLIELARTQNQIGIAYADLSDFINAIKYYASALSI